MESTCEVYPLLHNDNYPNFNNDYNFETVSFKLN